MKFTQKQQQCYRPEYFFYWIGNHNRHEVECEEYVQLRSPGKNKQLGVKGKGHVPVDSLRHK